MLAIRYTAFAIIATALNLTTQSVLFYFYSGAAAIYLGLAFGTVVGLLVKYLLDKHYIFYAVNTSNKHGKEFFLYSLIGGFTTLLFWGSEIGFDYIFDSEMAKYAGGAIGLSLGYCIKYQLDKRYVFINNKQH